MSEEKFPKESEKTVYQRDKTAKEPVQPADTPKPPVRPKIKPKKVFVAKKQVLKTGKPMEHRVRHIKLSSMEAAQLIRQTLIDFQKELAAQPTEDPDKEFHDREKLEKFFSKLSKKYSSCTTKGLGGELGWIYKGMKITDAIMTQSLVDTIMNTEKYTVSEPIKTRLGIHLLLLCESQIHVPKEKDSSENPSQTIPGVPN